MLVEFSVKNFKSFKERQTLSMVASKSDQSLPQNLIQVDIPGLKNTNLLKSAVIYGANASGKSNFLDAYKYFMEVVVNSFRDYKPNENFERPYFLLDNSSNTLSTEFEVLFILDDVLHQFGFTMNDRMITEEWLLVYQSSKPQKWYQREFNEKKKKYDWYLSPTYLKGEKDTIKESTRNNTLFLSTATQLKHNKLSSIYTWFNDRLICSNWFDNIYNLSVTGGMLYKNDELKNNFCKLLSHADIGISDVTIDRGKIDDFKEFKSVPEKIQEGFIEEYKEKDFLEIKFTHKNEDLNVQKQFDIDLESRGTVNYFRLMGPMIDSTYNNYFIMIDELSSSLHPVLARDILKVYYSLRSKSQVVLTTHDTTLIDSDLFRRDQIWFTEKNNNGASILYPLTDYKPRKDESLEKGYLAGRYGAIPLISSNFSFE